MELSQLLSWIGVVTGASIGVPQLIKTFKRKSATDVSAMTFVMIIATCICMISRAIVIKELAFVFYYAIIFLVAVLQLFLMWKYRQ